LSQITGHIFSIDTLANKQIDIMNILEEIVAYKRKEVAGSKTNCPVGQLEKSDMFSRKVISMKKALTVPDGSGIIAEFKQKSPSKGIINSSADIEQVTTGYVKAGAAALSILTDNKFFGGSNENLLKARKINACPILRKEFIIDEYQIVEAKSIGADAILLIASCLSKTDINRFARLAKSLNLEILLELHDESELDKISSDADMVGINNRNLKNFNVDLAQSIKMAAQITDRFLMIAESGIDSPDIIKYLKKCGFKGFLIGEYFMRSLQPEKACEEFIKKL